MTIRYYNNSTSVPVSTLFTLRACRNLLKGMLHNGLHTPQPGHLVWEKSAGNARPSPAVRKRTIAVLAYGGPPKLSREELDAQGTVPFITTMSTIPAPPLAVGDFAGEFDLSYLWSYKASVSSRIKISERMPMIVLFFERPSSYSSRETSRALLRFVLDAFLLDDRVVLKCASRREGVLPREARLNGPVRFLQVEIPDAPSSIACGLSK